MNTNGLLETPIYVILKTNIIDSAIVDYRRLSMVSDIRPIADFLLPPGSDCQLGQLWQQTESR
jgi:hypothetical protein